jgi:hypothetical protein
LWLDLWRLSSKTRLCSSIPVVNHFLIQPHKNPNSPDPLMQAGGD